MPDANDSGTRTQGLVRSTASGMGASARLARGWILTLGFTALGFFTKRRAPSSQWIRYASIGVFVLFLVLKGTSPGGARAHAEFDAAMASQAQSLIPRTCQPSTTGSGDQRQPTRMMTRLVTGTRPSAPGRCGARREPAYAPAVPRIAPRRAKAPAVAAVRVRPGGATGPGGGEGAQVVGGLAADQPDGQARARRAQAGCRRGRPVPQRCKRLLVRLVSMYSPTPAAAFRAVSDSPEVRGPGCG